MFFFEYFKLIFVILLLTQYNIQYVQAIECVIKNKAYSNEYLYQGPIKHKNVVINAYMEPIEKINDLDRGRWIIRSLSNDRITIQNKKTKEYLCAFPLSFGKWFLPKGDLNFMRSNDLNCIWIQMKSKNEDTKHTFLLWNALYFRQMFADNVSHSNKKRRVRPISLSQEKTNKANMKNNFKWIINCA